MKRPLTYEKMLLQYDNFSEEDKKKFLEETVLKTMNIEDDSVEGLKEACQRLAINYQEYRFRSIELNLVNITIALDRVIERLEQIEGADMLVDLLRMPTGKEV